MGRLLRTQLVNIGWHHPSFDSQRVVLRDDEHQRFAGSNDAAPRMKGQLVASAGLRRSDDGMLELVLRCDLALAELGDLGVDVA